MLNDLYERGLKQVLLIITDGLSGIKDACLKVYPKANHQTCWVHVQRNIEKMVRFKDRKEIMDSVKPLYGSRNINEALLEFDKLKTTISSKYPKVITMLENNESLFSFL